MRSLTSIESATSVFADLEFHLKLSDQSTTFIFYRNDIAHLTSVQQEIAYGGGFGKPSSYTVTLNTSVDFIKTYRSKMINGTAFLKIYVNSDDFTPYVGTVKDLTRYPSNPHVLQLQVYDRFLNTNPKVPQASIVDSYSTVHPEVIKADMGYPLYYGKHTRPFYMTPVDCDISVLYGPRNVSSENHVSSLWFHSEINGRDKANFIMYRNWEQQSGALNISSSAIPFEIGDYALNSSKLVTVDYIHVDQDSQYFYKPTSDSFSINTVLIDKSINYYKVGGYNRYLPLLDYLQFDSKFELISTYNSMVNVVTKMNLYSSINSASITNSNWCFLGVYAGVESGGGFSYSAVASIGSSLLLNGLFDVQSGTGASLIAKDAKHSEIRNWCGVDSQAEQIIFTTSFNLFASLNSAVYKNYSIYATQINCVDIAISENPFGIVEDLITNHSSFDLVVSQNSQAQYDCSSYNFQCFMGERRDLIDILDEFGEITAAYMWIGDSGYINTRTFQNSAVLTNSALIDFTITTCDFVKDSLYIYDNPLGTTSFVSKKGSRVKLDYDYDFLLASYNQIQTADKNNNAYCNSIYASGVQTEIDLTTKYIKESLTASLYLNNVVRKSTQNEQIVGMTLPARFFQAELGDVFKLQHPILDNSESLFQIVRVAPDYLKGQVDIMGYEILN